MAELLYLDNNATTRPLPEVVEVVARCLSEGWANPSSIHRPGAAARRQVELARESLSRLIGCQERELLFCSGGTESVNLALFGTQEGLLGQAGRPALVTSKLEHSAVRESAEAWIRRGGEVIWAEHAPDGPVRLDWLATLLRARASDIALVSLMWVNNETGVVQPVEEVGALCRQFGVRFHVDATQAVGRLSVDVASMQLDLLSFAGHKFHGPKGVGGLYVRRGIRLSRQVIGGPQERDRRGGTENVPGIVGMGVAADAARRWLQASAPELSTPGVGSGPRVGHSTPSVPSNARLMSGRESADADDRSVPALPAGLPSPDHLHAPAASDGGASDRVASARPFAEASRPLPTPAELAGERDRFEEAILAQCPGSRVNAHRAPRAWTTTNIAFPRLEAEAILLLLSEQGVCASAGAACSSGSLDPSPVLLAMGIAPEYAHGSVRFSISRFTTRDELDQAAELVVRAIAKLGRSSGSALPGSTQRD